MFAVIAYFSPCGPTKRQLSSSTDERIIWKRLEFGGNNSCNCRRSDFNFCKQAAMFSAISRRQEEYCQNIEFRIGYSAYKIQPEFQRPQSRFKIRWFEFPRFIRTFYYFFFYCLLKSRNINITELNGWTTFMNFS